MPSPTSPFRRSLVVAVLLALLACCGVTVAANPSAAAPTPQGVSSAARDNGRIDVVERTAGGTVRMRSLQAGAWTAWAYLDGQTQHDPEVASWGNDRADVFVVGGDGAIWHRAQNGTAWSGWQSLGGYATASPAAVYSAANRLDVVVRGGDGALWGKSFNGTAWTGWYSVGGYVRSAPTIASWGPNRLDVFAAGGDGQLWHRPFSGAWGNWSPLGGVLTAAPGATSWGAGRLDVAVRGADGAVWLRSWLGTQWSQWGSLGGSTIGAPDLATRSAGTLDLVTRGTNGSLYTRAFNGAWSGWAAVPNAHQGLEVDDGRLPAADPGFPNFRIGSANYQPFFSDSVGAFRVNCALSHMNYDDPIVFPGQPDATHLHAFFGNTNVNAFSTSASIANSGNSTCSGGIANRSAYWAPAMVDTATNSPVLPWGYDALQAYYKTGYRGVPSNTVVNFPPGLRMIAGDSRRTSATPVPIYDSPVAYSCLSHVGGRQQYMLQCAPGDQLIMSVMFPQCWDGVNLDSPNHQSHMAYGTPYGLPNPGCPRSHPVPLPEVTMNMRYVVPAGGMSTWRLSSDTYSGPPGYSGHADWWHGWHAPTFQRVIDNCYSRGLDCQMNLLGDGQALN